MKAAHHNAAVLADTRLTSSAKLLWLWFGLYEAESFRLNVHEAAAKLGMSDRTVRRALETLHMRRFIIWRPSVGGGGVDRCGAVCICQQLPAVYRPNPRLRRAVKAAHSTSVPHGWVTIREAKKLVGVANYRCWRRLLDEHDITPRPCRAYARLKLLSVDDVHVLAGTWRTWQKERQGTGLWSVLTHG